MKETEIFPLLNKIAQALYDKRAKTIIVLDLQEVSSMTDFFVIAEGSVSRHVKALGDACMELLEKEGHKVWNTEGLSEGDWVVLDFGDFMIHLFTPEMRTRYALEEVWQEAKIVDVEIEIHEEKKL